MARSGHVDPTELTAALDSVGLAGQVSLVDSLVRLGSEHAVRRELEDSQRAVLEATDTPMVELPKFPGGIDLPALYDMARTLSEARNGMPRNVMSK